MCVIGPQYLNDGIIRDGRVAGSEGVLGCPRTVAIGRHARTPRDKTKQWNHQVVFAFGVTKAQLKVRCSDHVLRC
jgi:hypothetical protein